MDDKRPCHKKEIGKLNRIAGQVEGVKRMIEEERDCPDILAQLKAVRSAVRTVEAHILESHLQHCVAETFSQGSAVQAEKKIDEIKALFKRYDEV
ncbi:MAG: metal-sensitive transcriptional regulator [Alphaproteobacteria bacterium]